MEIRELKESLRGVRDPRRAWGNLRHKLEDILIIGLCSTICCGEDFVDMEEFGKDREVGKRTSLTKMVTRIFGIAKRDTGQRYV
jgi:hypothetical protein